MTAPEVASRVMTRSEFLEALRVSGIVPTAQFETFSASLDRNAMTGPDVARELIKMGILTKFQSDRLLAGKTDGFVIGQYIVLDYLSKSRFGRLYKAKHRTMNRLVALKIFAPDQTRDPERRAAVQHECRSAARLAHPNLITILDTNQINDRLFIVLEYVEGSDIEFIVNQEGTLSIHRACELTRQAALGLQHAHEKGMYHGAVDPGSFLVGRPGGGGRADRPVVKLANFGLGRAVEIGSSPDRTFDPTDYRAPELERPNVPTSVETDLYSLGCVLFYMLTGRPPYPGGAAREASRHEGLLPPPPLEYIRPDVPPSLLMIVRRALAQEPDSRFRTLGEFASMLEPFAGIDDPSSSIDWNIPIPSGPNSSLGHCLTGIITVPGSTPIPKDQNSGRYPGLPPTPRTPTATPLPRGLGYETPRREMAAWAEMAAAPIQGGFDAPSGFETEMMEEEGTLSNKTLWIAAGTAVLLMVLTACAVVFVLDAFGRPH